MATRAHSPEMVAAMEEQELRARAAGLVAIMAMAELEVAVLRELLVLAAAEVVVVMRFLALTTAESLYRVVVAVAVVRGYWVKVARAAAVLTGLLLDLPAVGVAVAVEAIQGDLVALQAVDL